MIRKTIAVATKELRQIARDHRTLLILLFVPAMFLLLYGYALNFDIRNVALAVQDRDRSEQSRALVSAFINSGYFQLAADVTSDAEIEELIDHNRARAALVIPARYGRDLLSGTPTSVQVLVDGDNSNTATTVIGYAQAIVGEISAAQAAPSVVAAPLRLEPRVWYNPQLRSTLFLVPGLIGMNLMGSGLWVAKPSAYSQGYGLAAASLDSSTPCGDMRPCMLCRASSVRRSNLRSRS